MVSNSENIKIDDILSINDEELNKQFFDIFKLQTMGITEHELYKQVLDTKLPNKYDNFKLEVLKRNKIDNGYIKLNQTMIANGPVAGITYFIYNNVKRIYVNVGIGKIDLLRFNETYRVVKPEEILAGPQKHIIYFTKDITGNYVKTPELNSFASGETYYICLFDNDYYIKRKL